MADITVDVSGLTFDMDGDALVGILLPKIISSLESNGSFAAALVSAIWPQIQSQVATIARTTATTTVNARTSGPFGGTATQATS